MVVWRAKDDLNERPGALLPRVVVEGATNSRARFRQARRYFLSAMPYEFFASGSEMLSSRPV